MNFKNQYQKYQEESEKVLKNYIEGITCEKRLKSAIEYSLFAGGKRIRPVIALASADLFRIDHKKIYPYLIAIELIHTYSLVHDDLPCMDNDDFRRGKPSNHKVYGEGVATLAGDALLNLAVECVSSFAKSKKDILSISKMFELSGVCGMIGGQILDLNNGNNEIDANLFEEIVLKKTAALIKAPLLIASIQKGKKHYTKINKFGNLIGKLFQITDDILDETSTLKELGKTPKKDAQQQKLTAIKVYGSLEEAKLQAESIKNQCIAILKTIKNSEFFIELTNYVFQRRS